MFTKEKVGGVSLLTTHYSLLTTHYSLLTLKLKRNFPKFKRLFLVVVLLHIFLLTILPGSAFAYTTNMSASVVIGQTNFTSNSADQGGSVSSNTLQFPESITTAGNKLIIVDRGNNRVLIYNSVPTTNNVSADVVIGQSSFSGESANQGGSADSNTLSAPNAIFSDGTRLFIADTNNNRVLIYNSIPTSNNASADVVIGQSNFTATSANQGGSAGANTLNSPRQIFFDGTKLFITDLSNNRVLVFNSIPTSNNASADVVIGQASFSGTSANQGGSVGANTLNAPWGIYYGGGKLFIAERLNHRVLIFNNVPTTNNASADVVIGQTNFSSNSVNQGGSTAANTLRSPQGIDSDGTRLFIADSGNSTTTNNRVLIYNQVPTSNNASADLVIGEPDFVTGAANQGGSAEANTLNSPRSVALAGNKLLVGDINNNRVLIFDNIVKYPGLTLNNAPEGRENNQLRFKGTATVDSPYTVKNVEFSVNGGSFSGATATDGGFDETSEEYYFDFTPTSNQPKDSNGNLIDGYTVRVKSTNNNTDVTDRLFYFSPFDLHAPADNVTSTTACPVFEFSVNKQRLNLQDALSKYQVQVRKGGSDSSANWGTLIDDIPIDFRSVKNERTNKQWEVWGHLDTNNGVYETDKFYATYSDESSRIKVYSKVNSMSGTYQWKIVAVDKSGHNQETGTRNLFVSATSTATTNYFPLAVLNISGLGNPFLNSYSLSNIKSTYYTSSSNPIFYGIAWTNSKVTLKLTDQNCKTDCTKTYSTTANAESRYGINIPGGGLSYGKKYTANLSVALEDKYNELPQFTLSIGGVSSPSTTTTSTSEENNTEAKEDKETSPGPSPAPSPTPVTTQETQESSKRCIWFICW